MYILQMKQNFMALLQKLTWELLNAVYVKLFGFNLSGIGMYATVCCFTPERSLAPEEKTQIN